jgi:hypothetical protein
MDEEHHLRRKLHGEIEELREKTGLMESESR